MNRRSLGFILVIALAVTANAAPGSSYIVIKKEMFGAFKPSTKVSEASLRAAFPSATITKVDDNWLITETASGFHGTASADFLEVDRGDVALYGIHLGDDMAKLAGVKELAGVSCMVGIDEPSWVSCKLPWLSVNASHCSIGKHEGAFSPAKAAGCKVKEIYWMTAAAR